MVVVAIIVELTAECFAQCDPRGCKNKPDIFPDWTLYKATKTKFRFLRLCHISYYSMYFDLLVRVCFCVSSNFVRIMSSYWLE